MDRVGDYEILGALGAGGMGQVLKVRNVITDRIEAMKVLLPNLAGRQELVDRFLREIKVLAGLDHPNIAALRTAFTFNDRLVMVMEYVEGTTLAALLERGAISPSDAVRYVDQVLQALSYAHSRNVIHRDIKPANIMLTPQGIVKLMDFGIARSSQDRSLTATGTTLGSLYYMSPEQVRGEGIDARSDLYAVGVSLYEMVTGQRPFDATSDFSILSAHLQQAPRPPMELRREIPAALNAVILMALAKDPNQRFQSAGAFRTALNSIPLAAASAQPQPVVTVPQAVFGPPAIPAAGSATAVMHAAAIVATAAPAPEPAGQTYFPGVESAPNRRGLWMAVGGLTVLGILIGSAIYVPRHNRTTASAPSTASTTAPLAATSTPAASGAASADHSAALSAGAATPTSDASANAVQPNVTPSQPAPNSPTASSARESAERHSAKHTTSVPANGVTSSQAPSSATASPLPTPTAGQAPSTSPALPVTMPQSSAAAQGVTAAELEDVQHDFDLLSARASSANDSLNRLRQQQAASGLGLRGDMASAQERMTGYLDRAQRALRQRDTTTAKKCLSQAEVEVDRLEKFLGH